MRWSLVILMFTFIMPVKAQKVNRYIEKGNQDYRQKQYVKANEQYEKALNTENSNGTARFNAGNARHKLGKYDEASKAFEAVASSAKDPLIKAKAYYNQGVSYIKQKKLPEAIDAFKRSLRLDPNDTEARENLQKALKELRQNQQPKEKQDDKNSKRPKNKEQLEPKKSRLSKEEAEKMLSDLQKEEKNLRKQLQKKIQPSRQLKDW